MALRAPGQRHVSQHLNIFTTAWATFLFVAFNSWIPLSHAAVLSSRGAIDDGKFQLKVLPIGDSITFGSHSSDGNGYRSYLHDKFPDRQYGVDFVGGIRSGTMVDRDHEGHSGKRIEEITALSDPGISAAPNIVLLHAGTNDANQDYDINGASARLELLIDKILGVNPKAVILVCKVIPSTTPAIQDRINIFNKDIPDIVDRYNAKGNHLVLVEMDKAIKTSDLDDNLHPTDDGYAKMASAWWERIQFADSKGWIKEPGTPVAAPACKATPSWYKKVDPVASGPKIATSDGLFKPAWAKSVKVAKGACRRSQLHFMDLDGDGRKDYACVDPDTGATSVWLNKIRDSDGNLSDTWYEEGEVATGAKGRNGTGVMFADLNGDGRDDYIYLDPKDGEVYAWINGGKKDPDSEWRWLPLDRIAGGVDATTDTLQMADFDGDGRADFCLVYQDLGAVVGWLNGGGDNMPDYQKLGVIASGFSADKGDKVVLGDYTGEGRADYMLIDADGAIRGLTNRLQEGGGLVPRWLEPFTLAEGPAGAKQASVRLADMTGDGKVDYMLVDEKSGAIELWENKGTGGKYQIGEGVFLCDLDGDGTMDYFWVDEDGKGWGYLNTGKGDNLWKDLGMTATGTGHKRESIRMGVLTSSHRADYIVVDEKTGQAWWWQNLGPEWDYGWKSRGEFAEGPHETIESYGWTFSGKNVRFADLDGDGLDDYIYVGPGGATIMWRNLGFNPPTGWDHPVRVAEGPGVHAQDVQFADTNGDGHLDYVVVDRIHGSVRTWHNLGPRTDHSIRWNTPLSFADGTGSTGRSIRIAEMTGDDRADYMSIDPDNGRINLWVNRCWPVDNSWDTIDCNLPEANNDELAPHKRWDAVGADGAFEYMIADWKKKRDAHTSLSFPEACSGYFSAKSHVSNFHCELRSGQNGCNSPFQCGDLDNPAGWFILNSFVSMNNVIDNIYSAVGRVHDSLTDELKSITSRFKATPPKDTDLSVILNLLGVVYGIYSGPIWNKMLGQVPTFKEENENILGSVKGGIDAAVTKNVELAKTGLAKKPPLDSEAALGIRLSDTIDIFYQSLTDFTNWIFDGSNESIDVLRAITSGGAMIGDTALVNDIDLQQTLGKSLYAVIIPQAWLISEEPVNVAVVPTIISCKDGDKSPDDMFATCIDGKFWELIAAIGDAQHCIDPGCDKLTGVCPGETCYDNPLKNAPGAEYLDGKQYGGLTVGNIIKGAVNTWKHNNKKNNGNSLDGKGLIDPLKNDFDSTVFDVENPGIVTIPVCTATELREAWGHGSRGKDSPNYPCP